MRFSPTRIVLAALAFIVGAVLALPMLMSRKAEAGDAPPKLEAAAGGGWQLAAELDSSADRMCDRPTSCVLAVAELGPRQWPDTVHAPLTVLHRPIDLLAYVLMPAPEAPWPDPQTFDRQRKYHLRP